MYKTATRELQPLIPHQDGKMRTVTPCLTLLMVLFLLSCFSLTLLPLTAAVPPHPQSRPHPYVYRRMLLQPQHHKQEVIFPTQHQGSDGECCFGFVYVFDCVASRIHNDMVSIGYVRLFPCSLLFFHNEHQVTA